jgi:hypothetical protein
MFASEFEPPVLASERPQTHALDRATKWIDYYLFIDLFSDLFVCIYIISPGLDTGFQHQHYHKWALYLRIKMS